MENLQQRRWRDEEIKMEMKSWSRSNGKVLNYGEAKELRKGEEMFEE